MMERHMDKPLLGQTILVTGASGGIGAAIVERVALEGGRPIIHYCKDENTAETLLDRIDGNGLGSDAVAAQFGSLAGIIRPAEMKSGRIEHALALTVPCTVGFVAPAVTPGQ